MPCGAAGSGGSGPVPSVPSMGRTHGTTHQATTAAACESQSGEKGESCHTDKHVGAGVPAAYADGPRQADASAATSPPPGASLQPSERSASTDADDSPPPCGAVNPVSLQSSCPVSTASSPESAGASGSSSAPLSSALTSLQSDSRQPLSSSAFLSAAGQPASSLDDRDAAQPAAVSHQGASAPGGDGKGVSSPAVNTIALAEILHGFDCVRGELFLSEEERQMLQHALKPYHFRLVPSLSARALAGGPGGRKGFSKRVASGAGPSRRLTQEVQRLQQAACSFAALPRGKRRQSKANSRYQDDDTSSSVAGADKSERRGSLPYDESGARSGANQSADGVGEAGAGRGPQYLTGGEFWMGPQGQFGHSAGSPGSGGEKTVSVVSDDASTVSRNSRAGGKGDRRTGGRRSRQMAGVGEEAFGVAGGARGREDPDHVADEGRHSAAGGARGRKRKLRQERDEVSDPQGGWADEDREDQKYRRRVRTGKGDTGPPSGASAAASGFEGIAFTPILRSMPWRESCMLILQHLKRHTAARWFLAPVDPELDGVPGYLEVISRPMDFGTIERKLRGGPRVYVHPSQWQQDVRQVFFNAFSFHPVSHDVWQDAAILAAEFERCCLQTDQVNPYYASTLAASGAAGACAGAEAPHDRFPSSSEAAGPAAGFAASAAAASRASPAAASVARGGPSQTYAPYYASASAPAVQPLHDNASWTSLEGTDAAAASHVSASAASGRTGRGGPGRARRQAGQHFETSTHVSDAYYGGVYGGAPQPTASASAGGSGGGKGRLRGAASGVLGSPRRGGRGRGRGRGAAAQLLQRCRTWGETSPKNGPYMVGHQVLQSGGRGRGGGFGGVPPYGSVQGAGAVPGGGGQMGVGIDPQAVWEAEAPPNAPLLPRRPFRVSASTTSR
ncbi:bromodomain-containing protein [Besnoitia besnoiti]|uniref:Bromodomain-containing protein n=1 Tax=Besnoitia besnoiti TaxID=94643 RepID=A0A2A9MKS6_BESBE|nr:bromodomain-containing protein [Besnoitia besnoiti]PFH36606.1 bromodomain-containing protein [Besnoitia besnoiti]